MRWGETRKIGLEEGGEQKEVFLLPNLSGAVCTVKSLRKTGKRGEGRREKEEGVFVPFSLFF